MAVFFQTDHEDLPKRQISSQKRFKGRRFKEVLPATVVKKSKCKEKHVKRERSSFFSLPSVPLKVSCFPFTNLAGRDAMAERAAW